MKPLGSEARPESGPASAGAGAFALLLLVFLLVRSHQITLLPIFIDESLHLFWSAQMREDAPFLRPFRDGKPLLAMVTAVTTWGAEDPLRAGRLTSVLVGAIGMWAAWRIGRRLFDEGTGLAAAALYLVSPFTFFYDRMVLADIYLSSFAALTLLCSLALVTDPRPSAGLRLGLALAGCVWAKASGVMVALLPLLAALVWRPRRPGWARALTLAYAWAALLAAFPAWYFFAHSSQVRKAAGMEEKVETMRVLAENSAMAFSWLWAYWTGPVIVAGLGALGVGLWRGRRGEMLLGAASLGPVAAFVGVALFWYPRYILFATVPFLVLAARGLVQLATVMTDGQGEAGAHARPWVTAVLIAAASTPALALDAALLVDPARAALPPVEQFQYVDGFSSGYGSDEAERRLKAALDEHPEGITVAADYEGRRTPFLALRAEFMNEPRVEVVPVELDLAATRALLLERAARRPTFLVTGSKAPSAARVRAHGLSVALVAPLYKPNGVLAGELFRIVGPEAPR